MADTELDSFLAVKDEPVPEAPAPEPEPEEQETETGDESDADPEPEVEAPKPGERTVPLAALEKQRRDHKERAARVEGELAAVRRQLEEMQRAAQQPPQQPQAPQFIDPVQDPQGYHALIQREMMNERLNISQAAAQREHGAEAVAAAAEEFRQAMQQNPALREQLHQQLDPYAWVMKQSEAMRMQREISADPAAYRAKLRAEIEAEMQATQPAAPVPVSPALRLNPSLANARSAAPRASGDWAGPTPLGQLFRNG